MDALLSYEKRPCLPVPMRDGVTLACDLYVPKRPGRYPGIVVRTPYGRGGQKQAEFFTPRGYVVLVADARGTGDSGGVYTYYNIHDGLYDGHDLVEWLAGQDVCDGQVGTTGGSAMGIYQLLTAATDPPHLRCMCASAYPLDFYTDQWYPGGVFRPANRFGWISGIAGRTGHQSVDPTVEGIDERRRNRLKSLVAERFARREAELRNSVLPGMTWAEAYLDNDVRTGVWDKIDLTPHIRRTMVPVLHAGVIYDHFGIGSIRGWRLHEGEKRLVLVPGSLGLEGEEMDLAGNLELAWFERFLKGRREVELPPAVTAWSSGVGRWLTFDAWPKTEMLTLYPSEDGSLAPDAASAAGAVALSHDPARPCLSADTEDYRAFEAQEAVATFTSAPLEAETTVFGHPQLHLQCRTRLPDANVIGRFCAVNPDGVSRALNFGPQRLTLRDSIAEPAPVPHQTPFDVTCSFWTVTHTFRPGERIRLTLSLSDYPFFANSPHAGELLLATDGACRLEIPVLA